MSIHSNLVEKLNELHINPSVLIKEFKDPMILTSKKMKILYNEGLLKTEGNIHLKTKYGQVDADSLLYDININEVELINNVNFNVNDMNLYSNRAYVKVNSNIFIAKGNVKYKQNDYLGSAHETIVNYQEKNVLFEGSVVIQQGEDYIKGDKVILDLETFEFKTIGRSKIKVNKDVITE